MRPNDQPALRSLTLRSFIFNAPTTFPVDLHRSALSYAALVRETEKARRKRAKAVPNGVLGNYIPSCLIRGPGPPAPEDEDGDRFSVTCNSRLSDDF